MQERRKLVRRTEDRAMRDAFQRLQAQAEPCNGTDSSGARKLMRRAIRHHCTVQIALTGGISSRQGDVWSPVQFAVKGRMLDLSCEGCSVFTRDPFDPGQTVGLNIVLDKEGGVNAAALTRWTKALPEKGGFATGFQFRDLPSDNLRKVEMFLKRMDATAGL